MRRLFQQRFRGFRVIDLSAFICLTVLVLGVYAFKAHAGGEGARIIETNAQIVDEQRRIRILDADLAHLEQPARLEQLSTQYLGLAPVAAKHETSADSLMEIARQAAEPATKPVVKSGAKSGAKPGQPQIASVKMASAAPTSAKTAASPASPQPATDPR